MECTSLNNTPAKTFTIRYGFVGGPLRGKKISGLLRQAGYSPANGKRPDIVIAHSTGTWRIPDARLTIYVGIPLLQKKPLQTYLSTTSKDIRSFFSNRAIKRGAIFILHSTYYMLRNPIRNIRLIRIGSSGRAQITKTNQAVYISNKDDPWQKSDQLEEYMNYKNWAFISLPGCHDDIWINPKRYVEIVEYYAKHLLA